MYPNKEKASFKPSGRQRNLRPKNYQLPEENLTIVAESPTMEENMIDTRILSRHFKLSENNLTSFQKIRMVDTGISKEELERFKARSGWDYFQLSDILGVARAKLIAKKGEERFDKQVSEKIVSLAELYSYGYEVFEDEVRFNTWIFSPNHSLAGLSPFDYLDTQFGREEIKDMIGRIDYGVYS